MKLTPSKLLAWFCLVQPVHAQWWIPEAPDNWTEGQNQYGARHVRWEEDCFAVQVFEFNNAAGPLVGTLHLENKCEAELRLHVNQAYLRDEEGFVIEPLNAGGTYADTTLRGGGKVMSDYAFSGIVLVPAVSKRGGNLNFSSTWIKLHAKETSFGLLIDGLFWDGKKQKLPLVSLKWHKKRP